MSEKLISVEFESRVDPRIAIEAVRERGACAIHNFIAVENLQHAAISLRRESMRLDEDMRSNVKRRQAMSTYALRSDPLALPLAQLEKDAPQEIAAIAAEIAGYVAKDGTIPWRPNEVIGHQYSSNHFIDRHRDYTTAHGIVAVLTLDGLQDFYVELDDDEKATKMTMQPGTLTMLRGYNGDAEARPYHWVDRPASSRLALSIREMHEHWDTASKSIW